MIGMDYWEAIEREDPFWAEAEDYWDWMEYDRDTCDDGEEYDD